MTMHARIVLLLAPLMIPASRVGAECESFEWSATSPAPVLASKVDKLNVRRGPGVRYPIVDQLEGSQAVLYAMNRCNGWVDVAIERDRRDPERNGRGWVYLSHTCTPAWVAASATGTSAGLELAPVCGEAAAPPEGA